MAGKVGIGEYVPGKYAKRKPGAEERVGHFVRIWESRKLAQKKAQATAATPSELAPCIAFSRKIGVGALEIADMVALAFNKKFKAAV